MTDPALNFEPLLEERYVLAVRRDHPLARKRSPNLAMFSGERWVAVARTSGQPAPASMPAWVPTSVLRRPGWKLAM